MLTTVAAKGRLEVGRIARADIVDPDHLMTVGQETVDQSGPDEFGRARDECSHLLSISYSTFMMLYLL